jgi:hypothetical protein
VITDATVVTKVTEAPIPIAFSLFFETPMKGHMPKNCEKMKLLIKIKVNSIAI